MKTPKLKFATDAAFTQALRPSARLYSVPVREDIRQDYLSD
ncbi:MAG: hypothetical protein WCP55_00440 [Lentisphaerota bacterium]